MFATIEQKILDRLAACAADRARWDGPALHIGPIRELERMPELRQKAPAIWVVYNGYSPAATPGPLAPGVQLISLDWYVVATAKSARGNGEGNAARDEAAKITDFVLESLLGFEFGDGKRLRLSEAPGPEYDSGYCFVPLAFACSATFKGKP